MISPLFIIIYDIPFIYYLRYLDIIYDIIYYLRYLDIIYDIIYDHYL